MKTIRSLLRAPLFTAMAVAALALGIGVNTAIFSALNATLLRPAFLDDPDQIAVIGIDYSRRAVAAGAAGIGELLDARASTHLFSRVVVWDWINFGYTSSPGALPERIVAAKVSPGWFETFGARPLLGRTLRPGEDVPGHHLVTVLSYGAWQRLFGGEPGAVGRRMQLNGESYEIVGVMPPEFRWPTSADLWCPWPMTPGLLESQPRLAGGFAMYARLRPGVTRTQAEAELQTMADRAYTARKREQAGESGRRIRVRSFSEFQTARARVQPAPLAGAVAFVLLIACANVAGLLLARGASRAREMAVRSALGASRWQMMRPLLAESLAIAVVGAAAGLAFAWGLLRMIVLLAPPQDFPERVLQFDVRVLSFTMAVGLAAGLLFGALPAWQSTNLGRFQGKRRARSLLVVGEVALALVLLVGAGLFLRSIRNLQLTETGFDTHGLITAEVQVPVTPARQGEPERVALFHRAVVGRLEAAPGITHAATASAIPLLGGDSRYPFRILGLDPTGDPFFENGQLHGMARSVTPDYFATLGVRLLAGRGFTDNDTATTEPVLIVDEGLAIRYFQSVSLAVDRQVVFGAKRLARIVGVAPRVRQTEPGTGNTERPLFYLPMYAAPSPYAVFLARGAGDVGKAIREAVHDVEPSLAVFSAQPIDERLRLVLAPQRIAAWLLGFFAAAALFLAALGLYGVISYSVSQRTQEIGIRIALGARAGEVVQLVMADGLRLAAAGSVLGLVGAVAVARLLARQLYGVGPLDGVAFACTVALMIAAAAVASWLPARRAARVDPIAALRRDH